MSFERIACLDNVGLVETALQALQGYSRSPVVVPGSDPESEHELLRRLDGADAALVSWRTRLAGPVLRRFPRLRYVGMCCSLYDAASANVDIAAAQELGIDVRGVRDYGDEGVWELILAELIVLLKGLGPRQWRPEPWELRDLHLGIIGLGATGLLLANAARSLGLEVSYFSRTRRPEAEASGIVYRSLPELLATCHAVSTHLPRGTRILGARELESMRRDSILINTSLGATFDREAFEAWIQRGNRFAIFDAEGGSDLDPAVRRLPNIIATQKVAGWTAQARRRLSAKVVENVENHLASTRREG